jgi:hypothetical protein
MAPESIACVLPVNGYVDVNENAAGIVYGSVLGLRKIVSDLDNTDSREGFVGITDVLRDLTEEKSLARAVSAVTKPATTPTTTTTTTTTHLIETETIPAFTLSIWRPKSGLLIIDSRNTHLALPTERLLANILSSVFNSNLVQGIEDVMHWPFFDNISVPQTREYACNALQVWLEVELERRPTTHLWLLGETATEYFLPNYNEFSKLVWQWLEFPEIPSKILVAPSLVELLQRPLNKRRLWHCLASHHQSV